MPLRRRAVVGAVTPRRRRQQIRARGEENQPNEGRPTPEVAAVPLPKAFSYSPVTFEYVCDIGTLSVLCPHCNAQKFPRETQGMCCLNGKVDLHPHPQPPPDIVRLLRGDTPESLHFLENIRGYNCAFQLTSFGCHQVRFQTWNPNFRIQGQVCHLIGALEPDNNKEAAFLQIYFMETDAASATRRLSITDGLQHPIILALQEMLHFHNKYIRQLKSAYEFARRNCPEYQIVISETARPAGEHARRFNAPATDEVAILMPNDPVGHRDVVLHTRTDQLRKICELHPAYDALQYPLLLPFGTDGWSLNLKLTSRHKITQLQFYCFHFFTRVGNYLLLCRRLLQQYMVDAYAKIECERLQFNNM